MYGHLVPVGVDDYLNTVNYPVEVPEYSVIKPIAYETGELEQLVIPEKNAIVRSVATIAKMIDMHEKVIPFKILLAKDIVEIYQYLSAYIIQLNQFKDIPEATEYVVKANRFKDVLERSINIIAKRDPKTMNIIRTNRFLDMFKPTGIEKAGL